MFAVIILVFWGGREGYQSILNTDLHKELSNYAKFLRMAVGKHFAYSLVCFLVVLLQQLLSN